MISRNNTLLFAICIVVVTLTTSAGAFTAQSIQSRAITTSSFPSPTALSVFGKKKDEEDLSYIESRDLTREEMLEINRRNEVVMNRELQAMTGISILFSIPILYLCWVAFFSE
jgi:selenocysteine-specific elongation factor